MARLLNLLNSIAILSVLVFPSLSDAAGFPAVLDVTDLNGNNGFALMGVAAGDESGTSVGTAGDINADGIDDLVIGAPFADGAGAIVPLVDSGASYVLFGGANVNSTFEAIFLSGFLDGVRGFAVSGVAAGDHSGASVGFAGDINHDGKDDLAIGAPFADSHLDAEPALDAGSTYVLFGDTAVNQTFSTIFLEGFMNGTRGFAIDGVAAGDQSGTSVGFAGDINHDGKDDLLIGAPYANPDSEGSYGGSYVLFGETGVNQTFETIFLEGFLDGVRGFAIKGKTAGDHSGFSIGYAGDINHDGKDDLLIGAPDASPFGAESGNSYVLFGDTGVNETFSTIFLEGFMDGERGFALNGVAAGDHSGTSVSTAGDLNGDGVDDLVIGAPNAGANGADSGAIYVLFGGDNPNLGFSNLFLSGLNGNNGFRMNGGAAGDLFGSSVSFAGDINDDGVDDLIIGAPGASPDGSTPGSGSCYIVFGNTNVNLGFSNLFLTVLDGRRGFRINGAVGGDRFGASVGFAGDINHDGVDDLVIGAPGADADVDKVDTGISYVVFGISNLIFADGFE